MDIHSSTILIWKYLELFFREAMANAHNAWFYYNLLWVLQGSDRFLLPIVIDCSSNFHRYEKRVVSDLVQGFMNFYRNSPLEL